MTNTVGRIACCVLVGGAVVMAVTPALPQANSPAAAAANKLWSKVLRKCGSDYFSKSHDGYENKDTFYKEYKGVTFSLQPDKLDEADRLNSIKWRGYIVMKAEAARYLGEGRIHTWHAGESLIFKIREQDHTWTSYEPGNETDTVRPVDEVPMSDGLTLAPDCAEIPHNN